MIFRHFRAFSSITSICELILIGLIRGLHGGIGYVVGLVVVGFGILAWWLVIGLLGRSTESLQTSGCGIGLIVFAFLLKLPLFILGVLLVNRLGEPARAGFLLGLGQVYFILVVWSLKRGAAIS